MSGVTNINSFLYLKKCIDCGPVSSETKLIAREISVSVQKVTHSFENVFSKSLLIEGNCEIGLKLLKSLLFPEPLKKEIL
jgi:hypothetical protein